MYPRRERARNTESRRIYAMAILVFSVVASCGIGCSTTSDQLQHNKASNKQPSIAAFLAGLDAASLKATGDATYLSALEVLRARSDTLTHLEDVVMGKGRLLAIRQIGLRGHVVEGKLQLDEPIDPAGSIDYLIFLETDESLTCISNLSIDVHSRELREQMSPPWPAIQMLMRMPGRVDLRIDMPGNSSPVSRRISQVLRSVTGAPDQKVIFESALPSWDSVGLIVISQADHEHSTQWIAVNGFSPGTTADELSEVLLELYWLATRPLIGQQAE